MTLTLTEQAFRGVPSFVAESDGQTVYTVRGKALSLRESLVIHDADDQPVARLVAGWPLKGYKLLTDDGELAGAGALGGIGVHGPGRLALKGDPRGDYVLIDGRRIVASVQGKTWSLTHRYTLDVPDDAEALLAVGLAVSVHLLARDA